MKIYDTAARKRPVNLTLNEDLFDVHRNIGNQRETIPFVVVVESQLYDGYTRRVVVPLVKTSLLGKVPSKRFNPDSGSRMYRSPCIRWRSLRCPSPNSVNESDHWLMRPTGLSGRLTS